MITPRTTANYRNPPIHVRHEDLIPASDTSPFRSCCPVCPDGVLLFLRDQTTLELIAEDNCIRCGQHFIYDDIEHVKQFGPKDRQAHAEASEAQG